MQYDHDGHTYIMKKLGLSDGKEVLNVLFDLDFFGDNGIASLMSNPDKLNRLERKLFGANLLLVNETGHEVPMSKTLAESHFGGRMAAYFNVLVKTISFNFEDFLAGGLSDNQLEVNTAH